MKYSHLLALACAAAAVSTGFSQTIPIVNATFSSPAVSGNYVGISGAAGQSTLPGWTVSAGNRIIDVQRPSGNPPAAVAGQNATQYLEDFNWDAQGWVGAVTISQVLTTSFVAGGDYSLTADATVINTATPEVGDTFFIANSSGTVLASTEISDITPNSFTQFTVPFHSTGLLGDTGAIEIGYASPASQPSGQDFMEIDNFVLKGVPEPSSIAIAALGGFALLIALRRRRA